MQLLTLDQNFLLTTEVTPEVINAQITHFSLRFLAFEINGRVQTVIFGAPDTHELIANKVLGKESAKLIGGGRIDLKVVRDQIQETPPIIEHIEFDTLSLPRKFQTTNPDEQRTAELRAKLRQHLEQIFQAPKKVE